MIPLTPQIYVFRNNLCTLCCRSNLSCALVSPLARTFSLDSLFTATDETIWEVIYDDFSKMNIQTCDHHQLFYIGQLSREAGVWGSKVWTEWAMMDQLCKYFSYVIPLVTHDLQWCWMQIRVTSNVRKLDTSYRCVFYSNSKSDKSTWRMMYDTYGFCRHRKKYLLAYSKPLALKGGALTYRYTRWNEESIGQITFYAIIKCKILINVSSRWMPKRYETASSTQ